jgi:hypothetical protein
MNDVINLNLSNCVVGPEDKIIVHVDDPYCPQETLHAIADKITSIFGENRSVLLVGNTIHVNIVRQKDIPKLPDTAKDE